MDGEAQETEVETGMEAEADAEVKGTPPMSVGLNTLQGKVSLVATKELKFRTFNNYS